jgi:hypothetical protein
MPALFRSKTSWWASLMFALVVTVVTAQTGVASADSGGHGRDGGIFPFHHHGPFQGQPGPVGQIQVVAGGLNQPKKITIAPDGSLLVALSGDAVAPDTCTDGAEPSCLDASGAIIRVTPSGQVSTVVGNLPSVSSGGGGPDAGPPTAAGPVEALYQRGALQVLFQNTAIDPTTGLDPYGPDGAFMGDLVQFRPIGSGSGKIEAAFGPFEAANNPDQGEGTAVQFGEPAIGSDPYSFVPHRGGDVVADAAANDLLFVSPSGHISVLAVFPTIPETAPPGSLGPDQTTPVPFDAQPVPTAVVVGPDGALYVGELGGDPFNVGTESIYRVVPGHQPEVVASGLTAVSDIAFDNNGNLLALEIDQAGLNDPGTASGGLPTPGAIIRVGPNGQQTTLVSTGLEFPTGLAVGPGNVAYVSNFGILSATGGPGGLSGQVVSVQLPR